MCGSFFIKNEKQGNSAGHIFIIQYRWYVLKIYNKTLENDKY